MARVHESWHVCMSHGTSECMHPGTYEGITVYVNEDKIFEL